MHKLGISSMMVLLAATIGCKDSKPEGLSLRLVEPASGPVGATTVTIIGDNFLPAIKASYDDESRSVISTTFTATLGGLALTEISLTSDTELTATTATELPVGTHDLTVTDPRGNTAELADAYTVLDPSDAGPDGPDAGIDLPIDSATDLIADLPSAPDLAPDLPPSGVHTVAGTGAIGDADGDAVTVAQFNTPRALATFGDRIIVADYENNRIRSIENGQVSTLAGSGLQGYLDGPVATAEFNLPDAIAIDDAGDVYVADSANSCIRKIAGDEVSTFAGTNVNGFADGTRQTARFDTPRGLAWSGGKLYVADTNNHRIRLIDGDQVTTLAGSTEGFANGTTAAALFSSPSSIAVDGSKVYVSDTGNHRIRLIDGGSVSTVAGTGDKSQVDGAADQATFWNPAGIVVDGAKIYVMDQTNHALRLIEGAVVTTLNGAGFGYVDGPTATALFHYPRGLCSGATGELYVADQSNHRIRVVYF